MAEHTFIIPNRDELQRSSIRYEETPFNHDDQLDLHMGNRRLAGAAETRALSDAKAAAVQERVESPELTPEAEIFQLGTSLQVARDAMGQAA